MSTIDTGAVLFQRYSVLVGCSVQAASNSLYKLLMALDTGHVDYSKALATMPCQVQEEIVHRQTNALADQDYHSGEDFKTRAEIDDII